VRSRLRFRFIALLAFSLSFVSLPAATALDERIIDIASVTWNGARTPAVRTSDIANSIATKVGPQWKIFTTFKGDAKDRSVSFINGQTLATPVTLSAPVRCEGTGYSSFADAMRTEVYKRLGIADYKNRYLIILTPFAGCVWEGRSSMGEFKGGGATITMQNSASAFVITHELGHALGIGHSNYMLCQSGQSDGPWGTDCKAVEYGGTMDVMGNVETSAPLSTYHLWIMGLISNEEVKQSWLTETIELSAVDVAGSTRAIFARDGNAVYWIEYRKARPESNYKAGLVIYRTDPPPISAVISPNPEDSLQSEFGVSVGTDIWMLNFDDYTYARSQASGSMTLPQGKTAQVFSGNISIVAAATTSDDTVKVTITRKADTKAPPAPSLVNTNLWRFPGLEIIKAPYDDGESAIAKFQGKIGEKIVDLVASKTESFSPTYLNPFTAPNTVRLRDLPEGDYDFALRAVDLWGNTSPWSETVKVSIDRGIPTVNSTIKVTSANQQSTTFSWIGAKDDGSGLCLTQLVNEEGWVIARSTAKVSPSFSLTNDEPLIAKAQVFDCIGNGMSGRFSAKSSFIPATDSKRTGKWSATTVQGNQGIKCTGKCSASFTISGSVSVLSGDGAADLLVTSKLNSRIPAANQGALRISNAIDLGASKRVLRVQGSNFTLVGLARVDISVTNLIESPRLPIPTDPTLTESGQAALAKMGFNQDDFTSDWTVLPMYRGTTLLDPSLDLCAATYKSEADRAARRQIAVTKKDSLYSFLSTEVVKYKSKAAAASALAELKNNYELCVKNKGGIESSGTFTDYTFQIIQGSSGLVPEGNRVLVLATIGKDIYARQLLAFYQFNADTFSGLYLVKNGTTEFSKEEITRWTKVAETMADRLLKSTAN
jgi:hypothetical protein